jgi:hypothetical protein
LALSLLNTMILKFMAAPISEHGQMDVDPAEILVHHRSTAF